jgi:hypothetical protein
VADYTEEMPENEEGSEATPNAPSKEDKQKTAIAVRKELGRIKDSENYRERIATDYQWQDILKDYHGKSTINALGVSDIYIPSLNLVFAYVQSEQPALYFRDPHIKINPKNPKSIAGAKILEKAINYIWRTKRIKRENKKNVKDTLLVSHSWFKVGYNGNFGTIEQANGDTYEFIDSEDFFGYRIPWDQVVFDNYAMDVPYDCDWIAHKVYVPVNEAREKYPNKDLQPTVYRPIDNASTKYRQSDEDRHEEESMVALYEVWDKKKSTVCIVSPGCDEYVEEPKKWPYDIKGFPFSFLQFNASPSQPYGIPDIYTFRTQVIELIKIRAQQFDHLKRFNRQFQADASLSDDEINQFTQGMTGAVVKGDLKGQADLIKPIIFPTVPQDTYAMGQEIKEDMINISGQSPQERGATQKTSTRTFRELAQIQKGAENRRSEKVDTIEDFIEDISGNLIAILQQFADIPYYVRITGKEYKEIAEALSRRPSANGEGAVTSEQGFTFTKEDIMGDFDIECVAGSTTPLNRDQTMDTIMQLFEMLPKMGITKGPLPQTLGKMLGENLGMTEIEVAIEQQIQFDIESQEAQSKQMQEMKDFEIGKQTAKTQIEAEKVAVKQAKNTIDMAKAISEHNKVDGVETVVEDKGPSESISYKDLPEEGRIQMAKQAGIDLTSAPLPKPDKPKADK